MTDRKRKREPVAVEVIDVDEIDRMKEENKMWSELPCDLLKQIFSELNEEDNFSASAVCKNWYETATSVRGTDQPPWLIRFPKTGDLHEFYDPSRRKSHVFKIPELVGSKVCCSKEGWLLMWKPLEASSSNNGEDTPKTLFFFNPFTEKLIRLPDLEAPSQLATFSCAPTSVNCTVCAISYMSVTQVTISTCSFNSSSWTTRSLANFYGSRGRDWQNIILCGTYLYCLAVSGYLCRIAMTGRDWRVKEIKTPLAEEICEPNDWKLRVFAKHGSSLYLLYTHRDIAAMFKRDVESRHWIFLFGGIDGISIFASPLSYTIRTNLPGTTKNRVYFSKLRYFGKRCFSYKLDEFRFYPSKQSHNWDLQSPSDSIWIDPPENVRELV